MATKKELTLLERFEKHASTKAFAKKVYKLVAATDFCSMSVNQLLTIPGMGRKAALLVVEVACDLNGVK